MAYLDKYLEYKNKAADKRLEANDYLSDEQEEEARKQLLNANRQTRTDYQTALNPYGYLAEQRRMKGLGSVAPRANVMQYANYQSGMGNNAANYINSLSSVNQSRIQNRYTNEAAKLSNQADYYSMGYDEYIAKLKARYK